ncbi:MAG: hypothetical protein WC875_02355 [Candidatus Absconditabacterales bacterium]
MKRYGISGSWRKTDEIVASDVKETVSNIIKSGDGIVTGGALGVDYIATEIVLTLGDPKTQLKIYLPISLDKFCSHYHKRAEEGVITKEQAEIITSQLKKVFEIAPNSIRDTTPYTKANVESYYARNSTIIEECDELCAFQVNDSQGTQDAIDKANELGKPAIVKKYSINK